MLLYRRLRQWLFRDHSAYQESPFEQWKQKRISNIYIPRSDVSFLHAHMSASKIRTIFDKSHRPCLPVYEDNMDNVVGIMHVHDVPSQGDGAWHHHMEQAFFVPLTMNVWEALQKIYAYEEPFLMVVDEHGGVDGLLSPKMLMRDMMECVGGAFMDVPYYEKPNGDVILDGRTKITALEGKYPWLVEYDDDIETVSGLIISLAGRIPCVRERIHTHHGATFTILDRDSRCIKKVLLSFTLVNADHEPHTSL